MQIRVRYEKPESISSDLLAVGLFEGARMSPSMINLDKTLGGLLIKEINDQHFEGKEKKTVLIQTHDRIPAKKVAVIGLGKKPDLSLESMRQAAAVAVKKASSEGAKTIAFSFSDLAGGNLPAESVAKAITEGALLADYHFGVYKTEDKEERERRIIQEAAVLMPERRMVAQAERGIEEGTAVSRAVIYARDLVNEPASKMTPARLLEEAKKLAELPNVTLEYLDENQARERGLGAFAGVAQGSDEPSYFIHLMFRPRAHGLKKRIVLIGKSITFDSGGLSLKPAEYMEDMKVDMAGGAAVLAVFSLLPHLKPHLEVHGILPATENMPSGKAQKPGDIVTTISGKTIEVVNTDAEGRLTFADALGFAQTLEPNAIVDLATLTGACMVALGEEVAGYFSTNERLGLKIKEAAESTGEKMWELPFVKEYEESVKSEVADYRNITKTRYGGAVTAAMFMKPFAGDIPWVHIDIAGPAWQERENNPMVPKGGTGFGVRTIVEFLRRF